jgi:hypothetical protein
MMERPRASIERPTDEYDFELTQAQTDAIALTDELLKHKPEGSPLTFVDMVLTGDPDEMLADLREGPFGRLLAGKNKQLAWESDGSYYPVLDVRKKNAKFGGMGLRAWGWDYDKVRYTKKRKDGPPYEHKEYPGEKDKVRKLELSMSYIDDKERFSESVRLYVSGMQRDNIVASSQVYMHAYMEQGYEGHGGKSMKSVSDEAVEWFLDFVARNVGDQPKSFHELQDEKIAKVRAAAEANGVLDAIDELIDGTWNAQALHIMKKPFVSLDGKSILECLKLPETAALAGEAAREVLRKWKDGTWGECFVSREKRDENG